MKLLIAYDGSEFADAAIVDLRRAGLPDQAEAVVLSVAELFPAFVHQGHCYSVASAQAQDYSISTASRPLEGYELPNAQAFAAQAAERLQADFPGWNINTETWIDSAAAAIIRKAHGWRADLIVLGSHGRSGLTHFELGGVAQCVLHHTGSSVRISRHRLHSQGRPIHILIGVNGSAESRQAVQRVSVRNWPASTEVRVIGVLDPKWPIVLSAQSRLSKAIDEAVRELSETPLHVSSQLLFGKPDGMLVSEADKWGVDCVFVGSRCPGEFEQAIHSVAVSVAAQAHCSVEMIRPSVE